MAVMTLGFVGNDRLTMTEIMDRGFKALKELGNGDLEAGFAKYESTRFPPPRKKRRSIFSGLIWKRL